MLAERAHTPHPHTHTHIHTHTLTEANQTFDERDIMATWQLDEHRTVVKPTSVPVKSREKSFALPGLPARTERRPPPSRRFHATWTSAHNMPHSCCQAFQ